MKRRTVFSTAIVIVVAIILGFIIVRNNRNVVTNDNTVIKMSEVTRSVFYAPQYVAINNGYFKEYGIEIDLMTGQRSRCSNDISIIW